MNTDSATPALQALEGQHLSAITFVQDYVQLHFDGPYINAFVWPRVKLRETSIEQGSPGYRDLLCEQIGKGVASVRLVPNEMVSLVLADCTVIEISLKAEDREIAEAAIFQDGAGRQWSVW